MDRGRVSPASEAVLPLSIEQQQQDHFDTNDDRYKDNNLPLNSQIIANHSTPILLGVGIVIDINNLN